MFSILTLFLSNRSHHVIVDGCRSKLVIVVSGVSQGSDFGVLLFLLCTSELFSNLENKLICYVEDPTLLSVGGPGASITVSESLNCELGKVGEWCDRWGMKLNSSKTKVMIVSRSRTMHPQSLPLTIGRTVMKESDDLDILGVTFDSKMTFDMHVCSVSVLRPKGLVSSGSPGEYSLIDCFLGDAFNGLSCLFWSSIMLCGARLQLQTLNWIVLSVILFFELGVCLSVTMHIVDLSQYYVCCTRSGVTKCTNFRCSTWTVCASAGYTRCFGRTSVHVCADSQQDLAFGLAGFQSNNNYNLNISFPKI